MRVSYKLMNLYCDIADFLKSHRLRLIALVILFVLACALGIRSGCGADAEAVLEGRGNYAMLVSADGRSVVGYIFTNLLFFVACFAVLVLTSFNFWLSLLGFAAFFYIIYTMGYTIAIYFSCFKLAALPYLLVCYVPFCFFIGFTFACTIVIAVDCGVLIRRLGYFCMDPFKEHLPLFICCGSITVVVVLFEGVLGAIFTSGLII